MDYFDRKIIIIRNPLDSGISFFNGHILTEKYRQKGIEIPKNVYLDNASIKAFEILNFKEIFLQKIMRKWMNFYNEILDNCSKNCLLVEYENIKSNTIYEMTKILKFLGLSMTKNIQNCLMKNLDGHFKRKKIKKGEIKKLFSKEQLDDFENIYSHYKKKLKEICTTIEVDEFENSFNKTECNE